MSHCLQSPAVAVRRVRVEVTPAFYRSAERIWGPLAEEWRSALSKRFTLQELELIIGFLRTTNRIGGQHLERLSRRSSEGRLPPPPRAV